MAPTYKIAHSILIPTAVRTSFLINNPLHSIFPSLQDTDNSEYMYNDKVGTAAYRTHPSWQYWHTLSSYYKSLLLAYTNVRTLVQNALTMPQWLSLGVETANSKWAVRNMAAVCVTGQYVLQMHVVPRHADRIQGSASTQLIWQNDRVVSFNLCNISVVGWSNKTAYSITTAVRHYLLTHHLTSPHSSFSVK
jgi:hypothetical protein